MFFGVMVTFNSIDRVILWRCLSLDGVAEIFTSSIDSLYLNGRIRVHVFGSPSSEFNTRIGVCQSRFTEPFLSIYFFGVVIVISLSSGLKMCFDIFPGRKLSDLKYADHIVLPVGDPC